MVLIKSRLIGLTISGARIMSEIRWHPAGTKAPQTALLSLLKICGWKLVDVLTTVTLTNHCIMDVQGISSPLNPEHLLFTIYFFLRVSVVVKISLTV